MNAREQEQHDALLDGGFVEVVPCCVCRGDEDAPPCGEDCEATLLAAVRRRRIAGYYRAARKAVAFARLYLMQSGDRNDRRVRDCLATARHYRDEVRITRMLRVFAADYAEAAE